MKSYLGIDCGSVSIKFALIQNGQPMAKIYLKNSGLIPTIKEGLKYLPQSEITSVGVTGSGAAPPARSAAERPERLTVPIPRPPIR